MLYSELQCSEAIHKAVERMGFAEMTEIQEKTIPVMLAGRDVIAKAPTGTGKTCAFGIPVAEHIDPEKKYPQAVIMAPTRELAQQIAEELTELTYFMPEVQVACVYGGANMEKQARRLAEGCQIVVATPGRLMDHYKHHSIDLAHVTQVVLDEALVKTYAKFGITHDNNSIYVDQSRGEIKTMPILGDLYEILKENPLTTRLATIVSRFVTGSAQSFNRQTNVNLDNKYVVLDISELKGKLLPVGMMIALDYVWDQVKADRTRRKMVFIDEIWKLIGGAANKQAAEFCLEIFKIIRGYGGGALAATQDLSDFFGLEDGRYGRAILNNSKTKIILNLEPDEAEYVKDVLKLTRTEIRSIPQFERGEALISSNSNKVPVIIKASREEQQMITTDRAELEAMLNELKAVADIAESGSNGSSAGLTGGMEGKDAED